MIASVSGIQNSTRINPVVKWFRAADTLPPIGKWVVVRTAHYRGLAQYNNGIWRRITGEKEENPIASWREV